MGFPIINSNSTFADAAPGAAGKDRTGNDWWVYAVPGWGITAIPVQPGTTAKDTSENVPMPSVRPNNGILSLELADRPSLIRFEQRNIPLEGGQRYLLNIRGDAKLKARAGGDQNAVLCRVVFYCDGRIETPWQSFTWNELTSLRLEVFDSAETQSFGFDVEFHCPWGNIDGSLELPSITVEKVDMGYANARGTVLPVGAPPVNTSPAPTILSATIPPIENGIPSLPAPTTENEALREINARLTAALINTLEALKLMDKWKV